MEHMVPVYFLDDGALEPNETFTVVLDHTIFDDNIILHPRESVVTIFDDDSNLWLLQCIHVLC